jgi:hypothetical protein
VVKSKDSTHIKVIIWFTSDETTLGSLCCSSVVLHTKTTGFNNAYFENFADNDFTPSESIFRFFRPWPF